MKNFILTICFTFCLASISFSQNIEEVKWEDESKFSIGLHLGGSQSGTDTHSWGRHGEGVFSGAHFMWGVNAKYNMTDAFAVRANFFKSNISGDDANLTGPCSDANDEDQDIDCHPQRGWSFTSPLTEFGIDLEWELFGNRRYGNEAFFDANGGRVNVRNISVEDAVYYDKDGEVADISTFGQFKKTISPYVSVGAAVTWTDPVIDFGEDSFPNPALQAQDVEDFKTPHYQFPVGLGLRIDLSKKLYLDLEARSVLATSDMLDKMQAVTHNENELNNDDTYQFLAARINYRLGGIGDNDNDGINNNYDKCPNVPGLPSMMGCPDTDGDGITDGKDSCPQVPGMSKYDGCPDTDGDGIGDHKDVCPEVAGIVRFEGCPDTDGDGIQDKDDKCPSEAGVKDYAGCPPPDRDKDGVLDADDACPDVYGTIEGCPDTDGDGIIDSKDKCPTVKGIAAEMGCPKKVIVKPAGPVLLTCETIYFNTNQSSVGNNTKDRYLDSKENTAIFNRAMAKLNENPSYRASINGHTDSRNTDDYNQKLSERRANEVMQDMIAKGFPANRIGAVGYGESSPIDTNDTKDGRAKNRRVEICIYDK